MKKFILICMLMVMSFTTVKAQEGFNVGAHLGIPAGDVSSFSSFNFGLDLAYLYKSGDTFDIGFATGYTNFSGKNGGSSFGFVPLAGTFRYAVSDNYFLSADLGYGFATNGGGGAMYYQPKFGMRTGKSDVFAFYKGFSKNGFTTAAFGVGIAFSFN